MFGRGRRKARTTQSIEAHAEPPEALIEMAPEPAAAARVESSATAHGDLELDVVFMAMMSQLDDSLAAMARACDRIEQAVAGSSRQAA